MSSGVLAVENEFEFSFWFLLSLIISDVIYTVFICHDPSQSIEFSFDVKFLAGTNTKKLHTPLF